MANIDGGAVIWARKTLESDVYALKPDKWFKIWFFLVCKCKWKKNEKFESGQCHTKYEWIQEATHATKAQIDMFLRWAKKNKMLTTQKTTRGMVVNICKYDYFQDLTNYKNDTENDLQTIRKRNGNDTILKKEKKENKENNKIYIEQSGIVLDYLNQVTGRAFKDIKPILARLKDGGTLDQCRQIIDTKMKDPYFQENPKYYHPTTLFRASNWDKYLNQKPEDFKHGNKRNDYDIDKVMEDALSEYPD